MLVAPLSEYFGRRPVYLISWAIFTIFHQGIEDRVPALTQNPHQEPYTSPSYNRDLKQYDLACTYLY